MILWVDLRAEFLYARRVVKRKDLMSQWTSVVGRYEAMIPSLVQLSKPPQKLRRPAGSNCSGEPRHLGSF